MNRIKFIDVKVLNVEDTIGGARHSRRQHKISLHTGRAIIIRFKRIFLVRFVVYQKEHCVLNIKFWWERNIRERNEVMIQVMFYLKYDDMSVVESPVASLIQCHLTPFIPTFIPTLAMEWVLRCRQNDDIAPDLCSPNGITHLRLLCRFFHLCKWYLHNGPFKSIWFLMQKKTIRPLN